MANSRFFNIVNLTEANRKYIEWLEQYVNEDAHHIVYIVDRPLGSKYVYENASNSLVIIIPNHKLIFLNTGDNDDVFFDFVDDFCDDIYSLSDRYGYLELINRPKRWKDELVHTIEHPDINQMQEYINISEAASEWKRRANVMFTLLLGCINDIKKIGIEDPQNILDKVKHNIVLFDGDQTRFIYDTFNSKVVSVQGLSGTGKTELLLHKLKEVYLEDNKSKIFLTCHNKVLASSLQLRVPAFFNFMNVNKQIEWNKRLWVNHAWGSSYNPNSGLYSFLCKAYHIPFIQYSARVSYEVLFQQIWDHISAIPEEQFHNALDYIFIDERQDFPDIMIKVCEKVASKNVYWAGDIYQDIFETRKNPEVKVDVVLNRCYRTDPRTLMFAHALGMGLFDENKLDWQTDEGWKDLGYKVEKIDDITREIRLSREPIDRFQELQENNIKSVVIHDNTNERSILNIIENLINDYPTITPEDVCIIVIGSGPNVYDYIDKLATHINAVLGWNVNRAVESKEKVPNHLYITNTNNVKGLEFPFVICVCDKIESSYRARNTYYTMLTRSFLQTHLLLNKLDNMDNNMKGLDIINSNGFIKTTEPTAAELEKMRQNKIIYNENHSKPFDQYLAEIFDELGITDANKRKALTDVLVIAKFNKFDTEKVKDFITKNQNFY